MNDYEIKLRNERRYKTKRGRVCKCGEPLNYLSPPHCKDCEPRASIDPTTVSGTTPGYGYGRGRPPGVAVTGMRRAMRLSGFTANELIDATGLSPYSVRRGTQGKRMDPASARILVGALYEYGARLAGPNDRG